MPVQERCGAASIDRGDRRLAYPPAHPPATRTHSCSNAAPATPTYCCNPWLVRQVRDGGGGGGDGDRWRWRCVQRRKREREERIPRGAHPIPRLPPKHSHGG